MDVVPDDFRIPQEKILETDFLQKSCPDIRTLYKDLWNGVTQLSHVQSKIR